MKITPREFEFLKLLAATEKSKEAYTQRIKAYCKSKKSLARLKKILVFLEPRIKCMQN